ncbi:UNVERIFIED_CONTAM: putative metalloendopeptidase [Pseudacidovorax intermedius]|nr:putative metalloendopeptidase [Pseudacidovorax intermedius]
MKKLNIGILALCGIVFLNSCGTKAGADKSQQPEATAVVAEPVKEEAKEEGINLSYMDKSVRPQDDFFNYVNGNWVKTTQIPSDKASWGSFNALRENVDDNSLDILNKILSESYSDGSEGKKIQNLYASFMDVDKRNAEGLAPIKGDLAKIDAIKNLNDLQKYLLEATKVGDNSFYGWRVGADMKNSKMNAVYLGGPDLGLGRDYYQKVNEANTKTLAEYQNYVGKLFGVLGYKNSSQAAQNVVAFEKQLANYLLTLEQNRDANLRYNPKNVSELSGLVKNINLAKYLKEAGVNTDKVIVGELKYYQNMDQFLNQKNLPLVKDYLKYHLINGNASNLDNNLEQIRFDFYSRYLQGQKEQRPMNKRGLSLVNGVLGEAFGKLYVEKYFTPEAKAQMETYIDYILKSFKQHINDMDWMSPETKVKAQEKLSKFTVKIAYPDKWKDYSALQVESPKTGCYPLFQSTECGSMAVPEKS